MRGIKRTSIIYVVFGLFPLNAIPGWFGPDNYEDCVLEKMKGQDKVMIATARKACEKRFPFEKELHDYGDNLEIDWLSLESRLYLFISKNLGEYAVTRYEASFSKKACDEPQTRSDYTLSETFAFSAGETLASLDIENADEYKCMRTNSIWGKLRN